MKHRDFILNVTKSSVDFLGMFLDILKKNKIQYCVIGGVGVNAYVEPVVTEDCDIVVDKNKIQKLFDFLDGCKIKEYEHSTNISHPQSDIRIQIQKDERYQKFLKRARFTTVMGYSMKVALLKDIFKGKVWAYQDRTRRESKRFKDLADIVRMMESYPELKKELPNAIVKFLNTFSKE